MIYGFIARKLRIGTPRSIRVIALLASYNEERFIAGCLENLIGQGLQVYLIDNESTDNTVAIAERYAGRGLIGIETLPRAGRPHS
jgi:glycosyltransferase involved in cell wall biosynthesis